jgi:hypothetical protein
MVTVFQLGWVYVAPAPNGGDGVALVNPTKAWVRLVGVIESCTIDAVPEPWFEIKP